MAAVEVNSEPEFVGKNSDFQKMVSGIAEIALTVDDVEALKAADMGGKSVEQTVTDAVAIIGENMSVRRMSVLSGDVIISYVHNAAVPGKMGNIGVLVAMTGGDEGLGKQIAMHIAAVNPQRCPKMTWMRLLLKKKSRSKWTSHVKAVNQKR